MLGLSPTAVVMNDVGELRALAPNTEKEKEDLAQDRVERERKGFENIKGKDEVAPNPLDGGAYPGMMLEGETAGMYSGAPSSKKKGGKAKPNPRKAGAMDSRMMMMGMP
jgi:hypothetical protein